jgi:hypothetical protein
MNRIKGKNDRCRKKPLKRIHHTFIIKVLKKEIGVRNRGLVSVFYM